MNRKERAKIVETLKKTGLPLEIEVRRKLTKLGIDKVHQSRYFIKNQYGEVSKDTDAVGELAFKTFEHKNTRDYFAICLQLRLVAEIKKMQESKICFYEVENEKPENFPFVFPNFLWINNLGYGGGRKLLSELTNELGELKIAKSISYLQFVQNKKNNVDSEYEDKGNSPIFDIANDLLLACEYHHKKSISWITKPDHFKYNGLFPTLITEAELVQVIVNGNKLKLKPADFFFYLLPCRDLDLVPITAKEHYYVPILIINNKKLDKGIELIKKISNNLYNECETKIKTRPDLFKNEYSEFTKFISDLGLDKTRWYTSNPIKE